MDALMGLIRKSQAQPPMGPRNAPFTPNPQPALAPWQLGGQKVIDGLMDTLRGVTVGARGPEDSVIAKLATLLAAVPMGGMGAEKALATAAEDVAKEGQAVKGIKAFHGSPHDFEKFDLSKIGTGEGAQAYSHGLYFAENEGTARSYRAALTPDVFPDRDPRNGIAKILSMKGEADGLPLIRKAYAKQLGDGLDNAINDARQSLTKNGRMYEVNIKADPEAFLDWDKPLSQQSDASRKAARSLLREGPNGWYSRSTDKFLGADPTGQQLYHEAVNHREDVFQRSGVTPAGPEGATEHFKKAGVPGVKYLDQGSRAAGEGSRNYVVFDDNLIDILRKYMLAIGAGGAAAVGAHQMQGQER